MQNKFSGLFNCVDDRRRVCIYRNFCINTLCTQAQGSTVPLLLSGPSERERRKERMQPRLLTQSNDFLENVNTKDGKEALIIIHDLLIGQGFTIEVTSIILVEKAENKGRFHCFLVMFLTTLRGLNSRYTSSITAMLWSL